MSLPTNHPPFAAAPCEQNCTDVFLVIIASLFLVVFFKVLDSYAEAARKRDDVEFLAASTPEGREYLFRKDCEYYGFEPNYSTEARMTKREGRPTILDLVNVLKRCRNRFWKTDTVKYDSKTNKVIISENQKDSELKEE
jgi:hypothetical protein